MNFHHFAVFCLSFFGISSVQCLYWQSCGDSTDPIKIISLSGSYNSSRILYLTGSGKVAFNVTSPIQAQLEVRKKFFWGWTVIPCVENFGSCNYQDVCQLSPYLNKECPRVFEENKLPCNCPLLQGQYSAKRFPLDLNLLPEWIEHGTYRIKITLTKDQKRLTCLILTETL